MKFVNIIGGLGNQMFQYAFALCLQEHFPTERVLIDISHFHFIFFKKIKASNLHNGYEIRKIFPNANLPIAKCRDLMHVTRYIPNYWFSRLVRNYLPQLKSEYVQTSQYTMSFDPYAFQDFGDCYYEGMWQSISFYLPIQEKLKVIFQHPSPNSINQSYIQRITHSNSVGIHIRRGDYLKTPIFKGICELDYYTKAIKEMLKDGKEHTFFLFSNDEIWCKQNIIPLLGQNPYYFVSENVRENSCWDMFLMTYCKDLIIANSSFSWWGAFLKKQEGRVIAPKKWAHKPYTLDLWDDSWIRI